MLVELGGGTAPHPRADVVLDTRHPKGARPRDVTHTPWEHSRGNDMFDWVIERETVDEVYASHLMEHIPKGQPVIDVMNEAWRVLKPGGVFTMVMPIIGYTSPHNGQPQSDHIGWQPWADPTHVQFWWLPEQILYFCEGPFRPNADYGILPWKPLGPWRTPDTANQHAAPAPGETWWTVRSGWEGIVRITR